MNSSRGETVKQHILRATYSKEHILHSYGNATRPLSYKSNVTYLDVLPNRASSVSGSSHVENIRIQNGVLKYDVAGAGSDPYVYFRVNGVDSSKYNAIKMVVGSEDIKNAKVFFRMETDADFAAGREKSFLTYGSSSDGKTTVIIYLGNVEGYNGNLHLLRIDLGNMGGETIEIYSVEAYYVDID